MAFDCSTLKPGDVCLTNNGERAEYIGKRSWSSTHVYVFDHMRHRLLGHDENGEIGGGNPDLFIARMEPKKRKIEFWVNIFRDNEKDWEHPHKAVWGTKHAADIAAEVAAREKSQLGPRVACLHYEADYLEGDGL
jgi:hypothetical protein